MLSHARTTGCSVQNPRFDGSGRLPKSHMNSGPAHRKSASSPRGPHSAKPTPRSASCPSGGHLEGGSPGREGGGQQKNAPGTPGGSAEHPSGWCTEQVGFGRATAPPTRTRTITSCVPASPTSASGPKPLLQRSRPSAHSTQPAPAPPGRLRTRAIWRGPASTSTQPPLTCAHQARDSPGFGRTAIRSRSRAASSGTGARLPSPQPAASAYTPCTARGSMCGGIEV